LILTLHQTQYLPYLGFFEKAARSDHFILLDQPQFEKNDYQNRNRIKGPQGAFWLTVPVLTKGRSRQRLDQVEINPQEDWRRSHWSSLEQNYRKAPYWDLYSPELKKIYASDWPLLAGLNTALIRQVMDFLGLKTPLSLESETGSEGNSTERLISLCRRVGADSYLSGAGGKGYMDEALFAKEGIRLIYQHYEHPVYRQQYGKLGFVPNLCILDLLFNEGPASLGVLTCQPEARA
jgi:hypothetical protein